MPYLNEAKVIGNMAMEPELSMLKNGVPYCYIAVRLVQRTPDGVVAEDFIRVITYGDSAVKVARDFHVGDLVFCAGRLSPKQWRNAADHEEYELHFVADHVERLAMGDGLLPPVTIDEASNAKAGAFMMGEEGFIHSDTYRFRGVRDPNPPKLFSPQPNPDGTWHIPDEYVKQESLEWIAREKKRSSRTKAEYGMGDARKANPAANMDEAARIAAMLVSWNLPLSDDGQRARLPNGQIVPAAKYFDVLRRQDALMARQTPEMAAAITEMAHQRGIVFPQDAKRMQEEAERQQQMQQQQQQQTQVQDEPKPIVVGSSDPKVYFKD